MRCAAPFSLSDKAVMPSDISTEHSISTGNLGYCLSSATRGSLSSTFSISSASTAPVAIHSFMMLTSCWRFEDERSSSE